MIRDRLADFRARQEPDEFSSIEMNDLGISGVMARIEDFHQEVEQSLIISINELEEKVDDLKKTLSLILSNPQADEELNRRRDIDMADITSLSQRIQGKLKQIDITTQQIGQQHPMGVEHRIRITQHLRMSRKLNEVVTDYQLTQADHQDRCKARIQRQLEITGRTTTDDEIEDMIESGNPAIFTQGIIMETQQAKQSLADIEARHTEFIKIEKSMRELRDLFVDMATLVEAQGEMVDRIENHVAQSKSHVDKARAEVTQAIAYRSKARIKKMICYAILICILLAIVWMAIYV